MFLEIMQKLIMTVDDKIRDEKLQYDINKEAAKVLIIIINKYHYPTGEEILPLIEKKY